VRLSFAVLIDVAVKVKDWLLRDGRVSLGVSTQDLTQRFADSGALRAAVCRGRHRTEDPPFGRVVLTT